MISRPRGRLVVLAAALSVVGAATWWFAAHRPVDGAPRPTTGTIRGTCRLAASMPRSRIQPGMMDDDAEIDSPRVVEGEGLTLSNCVVSLPSVVGGRGWPETMRADDRTAWIDVRPGSYEPHVQWVRSGTQLAFRSALKADINVHAYRGTTVVDFVIPAPPK